MSIRSILVIATLVVCVTGCNRKEEGLQKEITQLDGERTSLQTSITEREKYIEEVMHAVNEVYADLEKARSKEEQLVMKSGSPEGPIGFTNVEARTAMIEKINDIGSTLKQNREKISGLQSKMKVFKGEMAGLNQLLANLKTSLQEREQSIATLEARVQGLEASVAEKTQIITEKEEVIGEQQHKMNTGYFIIGTRDDLEERGIITDEGGFLGLGSTTVMASGVDPSIFTPIDKTRDHTIPVNGKIDEILPHRSNDLFALTEPEENMMSSLTIVQPDRFWQDAYLVIVLD